MKFYKVVDGSITHCVSMDIDESRTLEFDDQDQKAYDEAINVLKELFHTNINFIRRTLTAYLLTLKKSKVYGICLATNKSRHTR